MSLADDQVEEALSEFLKVALLYDDDEEVAHALLLAGQSLERLDQLDNARRHYREILDDHPNASHAAAARERLAAL
jgi:TolA-binding protein